MLVVTLTLALCSTSAAYSKETIVELHPNLDIDSLDPAWANDTLSHEVINNIYEPLIRFKGSSMVEFDPGLADKAPSPENNLLSKDKRTYSFPIRQGILFHDGTALSCEDARYSLLRLLFLDRPAGGPSFYLLKPLAGVLRTHDEAGVIQINFQEVSGRITCDGQVLKLALPKPYAPLLSILAQYSQVVSKSWVISRGGWNGTEETWKQRSAPQKENSPLFDRANGTGPFVLEKWDRAIKQVTLKRNNGYWQAPARLAKVIIKEVQEFSIRRMMLARGDADISSELSPQYEPQWANVKGVRLEYIQDPRTDAFFFVFKISTAANNAIFSGKLDGQGIPPDFFTDIDVRKGFAYAFDYDGFIKEALRGRAVQPTGCIPPGILGHDPTLPKYTLDLEKAKAHLRHAWSGAVWNKGFKLAIYYNSGNPARKTASEILKKNIESLNPKFNIEVRALDWSTYLAGVRQRKFPMFLIGLMASFADPDSPATAFLHSEGMYLKFQGYSDDKLDSLVNEAAVTPTLERRSELYGQLQNMAHDGALQMYLAHPLGIMALSKHIEGLKFHPIEPGVNFYQITR